MIQTYFARVRNKLKDISALIKADTVTLEMVSADMGMLRGRVAFIDSSVLNFRELLSTKEHDYRFHWMDASNKLIVLWDTAPHYKNLDNFPYHKHLSRGVSSSVEMDFVAVLDYIKQEIVFKRLGHK
ncbi:MAG TPA: DUF6516 family protein [Dissulfurispiraceae bacterium]|nr:DUF6516 family protein [Dissulfurispiraceae bacterium]